MPTESLKSLAELVPEVIFDLLVRVLPGMIFLLLTYFTIHLNSSLSAGFAFPITSVYQFLALLVTSYLVGFLIEMMSFQMVLLTLALHNPAANILFPKVRNSSKLKKLSIYIFRQVVVYKLLGDPLDEAVKKDFIEKVKSVFDVDVNANNTGDVYRIISDLIKNSAPGLYLVLLKLHAEAMMFKNLASVCIVAIAIEAFYHRIANPTYLILLVVVMAVSYVGFVNLHTLSYKRTYLTFLSLSPIQPVPVAAAKE
jgi:hypothetical protein